MSYMGVKEIQKKLDEECLKDLDDAVKKTSKDQKPFLESPAFGLTSINAFIVPGQDEYPIHGECEITIQVKPLEKYGEVGNKMLEGFTIKGLIAGGVIDVSSIKSELYEHRTKIFKLKISLKDNE